MPNPSRLLLANKNPKGAKTYTVSKCCRARVKIVPDSATDPLLQTTHFYVCSLCNKSCDVIPEIMKRRPSFLVGHRVARFVGTTPSAISRWRPYRNTFSPDDNKWGRPRAPKGTVMLKLPCIIDEVWANYYHHLRSKTDSLSNLKQATHGEMLKMLLESHRSKVLKAIALTHISP